MKRKTFLQISLKKSVIGAPGKLKAVAAGLGLNKMHRPVVRPDTPAIRGMVAKISHLVESKEVDQR